MHTRIVFRIAWVGFVAFLMGGGSRSADRISEDRFVVVELFTSEGCSSCPPADATLASLQGRNIYPLSIHVDYWDNIGWKDPWSSPDFTKRQVKYCRTFQLQEVYTPQAVFNGTRECLGSNQAQFARTLQAAIAVPEHQISLTNHVDEGRTADVEYVVTGPSAGKALILLLVQKHAISNVLSGENAGRTLHHVNVVRQYRVAELEQSKSGKVSFQFPLGLTAQDCLITAFVQDRMTMQITGATRALL